MTDSELIASLSPGMRRALLVGFAGPFTRTSTHGLWREWPDIVFQTGDRRSFRNTITPLIDRGLAERCRKGFCRLNTEGLRIRAILEAGE